MQKTENLKRCNFDHENLILRLDSSSLFVEIEDEYFM